MGREENRIAAKRCLDELMGQHRLEIADELFSEEILLRTPQTMVQGRRAVIAALALRFARFPDLRTTIDYLVADEESAAGRVSMRATMAHTYLNQPPTFRKTVLQLMVLMWFSDARITEIEVIFDRQTLQDQLGTRLPVSGGE
jgi:predicted ester cyclase